jgi:hypothetical protein
VTPPLTRRIVRWGLWTLAALCVLGAAALAYSAYRRVETATRLGGGAWAAPGVVTEKLVEYRSDRLLPFDVRTYVVRYAYPNPAGQMRTGEQVVTRRFFDRLPEQGGQTTVYLAAGEEGVSAVQRGPALPAPAGWRAILALAALIAAGMAAGLVSASAESTL